MTRSTFVPITLALLSLSACDHASPPMSDAFVAHDAQRADDSASPTDGGSDCDARIGAKQASCGAPPSLAQLYRDMWCGMSPTDADIACFEAMTCQQMETEIHAGHFPCIGGH